MKFLKRLGIGVFSLVGLIALLNYVDTLFASFQPPIFPEQLSFLLKPYLPLDVSGDGDHLFTISRGETYIIKGERITFNLPGAGFMNVFPGVSDILTSHIVVPGVDAVYDLNLVKDSCRWENIMISDDVGSSITSDCRILINKKSVNEQEITMTGLRPSSFPVTKSDSYFELGNGQFIYLKNFLNGSLEVISNFGSYYATQEPCAVGQTLGPISIYPQIMEIYCGDNEYVLKIYYEKNITNWPAKILSFEPAPSMFHSYNRLHKKLNIITSCKDIYVAHYSYDNLSKACLNELEENLKICNKLTPGSGGANNCFMSVALRKGDFSICDLVGDISSKNVCYYKVSVNSKDVNFCAKISPSYIIPVNGIGENAIENCYFEIARDTKAPLVCEKIKNPNHVNNCKKFAW